MTKAAQVADTLRGEIGRMKPGDKLPSQRELVERFGFASQTIQNGLAQLRSEGLVVSAGNLGNFVGDGTVPQVDLRSEIKELRSMIQTLTERVEALEVRSTASGA
ncbi:winged helix-turn-helix domain-containing protein [Streptomyces sp. NPDC049906]|uniref:winged helix-turn-helix domain-containing protein n=1 Tax=Streptomyces sp. NPDC049906 TaxID=3155656 RepID=UPI00342EA41E